MPGLTDTTYSSERTTKHSDSPPLSPISFGQNSYIPPYEQKQDWTGYGLREPQWTQGPPPLVYHLSPYATKPLPPQHMTGSFQVSSMLLDGSIRWSIDQAPSSARLASGHYVNWQTMAAVQALPHEHVHFNIQIPGLIVPVHFQQHAYQTLTIHDILCAIYNAARRNAVESMIKPDHYNFGVMSQFDSAFPPGQYAGDDAVGTSVARLARGKTHWSGLRRYNDDTYLLHLTGD